MKTIVSVATLVLVLPIHLGANERLVVHEWGTFTTVSGSDGRLLTGLELEEHALPPFVRSHEGFAPFPPRTKGWSRPVKNVTVKMETPVLYFYAPQAMSVGVEVKFQGGSISQWYPDRVDGEKMPALSVSVSNSTSGAVVPLAPVDFSLGYQGAATWRVDVLAPTDAARISAPVDAVSEHFSRARVSGANRIRGVKGQVEGFIFYRGLGNFALPLHTAMRGGGLELTNGGGEAIPFAFVYEKSAAFPKGVVWWSGSIDGIARIQVPLVKSLGDMAAAPLLAGTFPRALERAGLTAEESQAMIATWRESYFERDGVRVFWIVPRAFTDRVLPIAITPKPARLERVLVGRSEVLTEAFEAELARDFRKDGGKRWQADRYFLAYAERMQQLGVVSTTRAP